MRKSKVTPVLLSNDQVNTIKKIQENERSKSLLGCAPSIHAIARQLMSKAIAQVNL